MADGADRDSAPARRSDDDGGGPDGTDAQGRGDDGAVSSAGDARSGSGDNAGSGGPVTPPDGRREVVVPARLYKTVAVFSTLLAIGCVVLGFWFLSAAGRVVQNPTGSLFVGLLQAVGGLSFADVEPYLTAVALVLGLVGLALVAGGGWIFAMGTRFRTEEMGKPKDEADEATDDG